MLPFTYEMYDCYCNEELNMKINNALFEYNHALGQLTDESTKGDFDEINYLKECLDELEYERQLIVDYKKCVCCDNI